jgi:EpsD family peptidyl-prolyl cis-trans isomerase
MGVFAASVTLSGCDQARNLLGGGKPSGQVVATVDGEEITALELRQEMGNFSSRDPAVMKAAQQRALQQIIMRRVLVKKAKEQELNKTADYALQVRRGEENLLVQAFQRKIAAAVAVPSRSEAEAYVSANPSKFSGRRVLIVDQLVGGPSKITMAQFQAAKTLDDVKALFEANNVPYQTTVAALDTLATDSRLLTQIEKLPPGEVFVIPQGGSLLFNRISESRPAPFQGDAAIAYATNILRAQKAQQAVVSQMEVIRKGADKAITYNEAYKPPAAAKGAGGAPGAAASIPEPK